MNLGLNILTVIVSFIGMELFAWLSHKYLMHGILWFLHKDHHQPNKNGLLERNDTFFLLFAIPAVFLFWFGVNADLDYRFWMGTGITLYGFTYLIIHDIFIHQRFKGWKKTNHFYFRAIRKAHSIHHKYLDKEKGECFGMLWVPLKYFKDSIKYSPNNKAETTTN